MECILVTGGSGFLGSRICHYFEQQSSKYAVCKPSHKEMDITDYEAAEKYIYRNKPSFLIHCGGISNTEYVANNPDEGYRINVLGSKNLARISGKAKVPMIFMSSDYVYQGNTIRGEEYDHKTDAFREQDACPRHEYGKQKLEAEQICQELNPDCVALRLTWMYDLPREGLKNKPNFLTNLWEMKKQKKSCIFARHEYRGITNVWEVVENLEKAMMLPGGTYNFGSSNHFSTIELAKRAADSLGIDPGLIREDAERYRERPRNITMSMNKIDNLGISFSTALEGLVNFSDSSFFVFPRCQEE